MNAKQAKYPQLRFKGFDDPWEQRKLGELVDRVKSYSLSRDVEVTDYTGYRYVHYGDIHTRVADRITNVNVLPNIKPGNYKLLKKGDICLADASEDYQDIAAPSVLLANTEDKIVAGLHTIAIQPKNILPEYLYYIFEAPVFRHFVYREGQGLKVFGISAANVLKYEVAYPTIKEQRKIISLVRSVDATITLHQRKLAKLKELKQGYLQKMFPKNGSKFPQLRFAGFADAWEQRKLGEVVETFNGDRGVNYPKNGDLISEGVPFINAGDLQNGQVNLESCKKISKEKFNQLSGAKIIRGDILYCLRGTIGKNAVVEFDEGTVASSLVDIRPKNIDGMYLFIILNSNIEYRQRLLNDEGAAQPNLSVRNLSKFYFPVPQTKEQHKISVLFKSCNELITLHQRKLEKLQELKKGYLQKMFC